MSCNAETFFNFPAPFSFFEKPHPHSCFHLLWGNTPPLHGPGESHQSQQPSPLVKEAVGDQHWIIPVLLHFGTYRKGTFPLWCQGLGPESESMGTLQKRSLGKHADSSRNKSLKRDLNVSESLFPGILETQLYPFDLFRFYFCYLYAESLH